MSTPSVDGPPLLGGGARRLFFAGKGGVGKTTLAVAGAVAAAAGGQRTLLVTTDPAAHIGAVLECPVGDEPAPVRGVDGLWAARIDPRHETERYKGQVLAEARRRYTPDTVERMAEELDSPCTEEIAVFRRFLAYLLTDDYPVVVFDTAPTGHTLRLLELPLSYSDQLAVKAHGSAESGGADQREAARLHQALALLRDPSRTLFSFVVYPEATPLAEAERAAGDLRRMGMQTALVLVNQVLPEEVCTHPFFRKRFEMQQRYLREVPSRFPGAVVRAVPLQERDVIGLHSVRRMAETVFGRQPAESGAMRCHGVTAVRGPGANLRMEGIGRGQDRGGGAVWQ